jgi:DeoR/GlpR family transcriptional regulator of sugar metabolism
MTEPFANLHGFGSAQPSPVRTTRPSGRQKRVLALVMEAGTAGPSLVARELAIGLSTAYRDLAFLEACGLIVSDESGKRTLTSEGSEYLETLLDPGA